MAAVADERAVSSGDSLLSAIRAEDCQVPRARHALESAEGARLLSGGRGFYAKVLPGVLQKILVRQVYWPFAAVYEMAVILRSLGGVPVGKVPTREELRPCHALLSEVETWWDRLLRTGAVLPAFLAAEGSEEAVAPSDPEPDASSPTDPSQPRLSVSEALAAGVSEKLLVGPLDAARSAEVLSAGQLVLRSEAEFGDWLGSLLIELSRAAKMPRLVENGDITRLRHAIRTHGLAPLQEQLRELDLEFLEELRKAVHVLKPTLDPPSRLCARVNTAVEADRAQTVAITAAERQPAAVEDEPMGVPEDRRRWFPILRQGTGDRERYAPDLKPPVIEKTLRLLERTLTHELISLLPLADIMEQSPGLGAEIARLVPTSLSRLGGLPDALSQIDRWRIWQFTRQRFRWAMPTSGFLPACHEYVLLLLLDARSIRSEPVRHLLDTAVDLSVAFAHHIEPLRQEVDITALLDVLAGSDSLPLARLPQGNVELPWDSVHVLTYRINDKELCSRGRPEEKETEKPPPERYLTEVLPSDAAIEATDYHRVLWPGRAADSVPDADELGRKLSRDAQELASDLATVKLYDPCPPDPLAAERAFWAEVAANPGDRDYFQFVVALQPADHRLEGLVRKIALGRPFPFFLDPRVPRKARATAQFMTTSLAATITCEPAGPGPGSGPHFRFEHAGRAYSGLSRDRLREEFLDAAREALGRVRPRGL